MLLHVPEFTQSLVLTVSVAVVFFNFTPLFFYSLTMYLGSSNLPFFYRSHRNYILRYRCLLFSISNPNLLSSAQLLFIVSNLFSTRIRSTRLF